MTVSRQEIVELIQRLPDPVDVEELIFQLYLREKLAAAEEDVDAGKTLTQAEVRAEAASWRR